MQGNMKRFTVIFAITMAAVMGLSLILPAISPNVQSPVQQAQPTQPPAPTLPPPPDTSAITFSSPYLHPSGLFTVAQPTGWTATTPSTSVDNARATLSNTAIQSIIQVDVDKPDSKEPLTLDDVDARFTTSMLAGSWSRYSSWEETGDRRRVDDRLIMDFALTANNQTYIARQTAWTDGDLIYSVRVVTLENARDALLYVLDGVQRSLQVNTELIESPFTWNAYYDDTSQHIIRYPQGWSLADSAPGRPTSISGSSSESLRLETIAQTFDDADAASAWVESLRPNTTVFSVEPVTRGDAEGFAVAYGFRTVDGDVQSGLAVLLNEDERAHVANLRFSAADVDLNDADAAANYAQLAQVMDTFYILPDITGSAVADANTSTE